MVDMSPGHQMGLERVKHGRSRSNWKQNLQRASPRQQPRWHPSMAGRPCRSRIWTPRPALVRAVTDHAQHTLLPSVVDCLMKARDVLITHCVYVLDALDDVVPMESTLVQAR